MYYLKKFDISHLSGLLVNRRGETRIRTLCLVNWGNWKIIGLVDWWCHVLIASWNHLRLIHLRLLLQHRLLHHIRLLHHTWLGISWLHVGDSPHRRILLVHHSLVINSGLHRQQFHLAPSLASDD